MRKSNRKLRTRELLARRIPEVETLKVPVIAAMLLMTSEKLSPRSSSMSTSPEVDPVCRHAHTIVVNPSFPSSYSAQPQDCPSTDKDFVGERSCPLQPQPIPLSVAVSHELLREDCCRRRDRLLRLTERLVCPLDSPSPSVLEPFELMPLTPPFGDPETLCLTVYVRVG